MGRNLNGWKRLLPIIVRRLRRDRFPAVWTFLHLRIVALGFPAIMPIAGLCSCTRRSCTRSGCLLLLNIHRRRSGSKSQGRIIGGSIVVIAGRVIGRAVTEPSKAWSSETTEPKASKAESSETGGKAPCWVPRRSGMGVMMPFFMIPVMMPAVVVPIGMAMFMMGPLLLMLPMLWVAFRSVVSRMAVSGVIVCGILASVMITVPRSVKSPVMGVKC